MEKMTSASRTIKEQMAPTMPPNIVAGLSFDLHVTTPTSNILTPSRTAEGISEFVPLHGAAATSSRQGPIQPTINCQTERRFFATSSEIAVGMKDA
jgi:hypothetical protein